jgi:ABC-type thiamin/hydroxymethylpyrimidine transport system permease subunit
MNMEPVVKDRSAPSLISLWWGVWILSSVAGWLLFRNIGAETAEELIQGTWIGMVDDLTTILSGTLAILIVRRIRQFQESWPPETAEVFA